VREPGMEPFEIMISESQERMAAIVEPDGWARVEAICRQWDVDATIIGEVTPTGNLRAFHAGELVGDIPARVLTDEAPRYDVECARPARLVDDPVSPGDVPAPDPSQSLRALLESPGGSSRRWVTRQYDQLVGSGTVVRPGGDAAVVRLTPSRRAIAVSLDGNGRRTWLDPRRGGMSAVCQAARNVACTGARPAAVTNCLNFGNPERPEIGYELREAIGGMGAACRALGLPVVSGNVSLYNEHDGRPIPPTPVVGVVGILEDAELAVRTGFCESGDVVLLAGAGHSAIDGSDYQKVILGEVAGRIPEPDLEQERALHEFLAAAAERGLLRSAHDVGGGGLAVAVTQSAIAGGIGVHVETPGDLFGEGDGRVVVSARRGDVAALRSLATAIPLRRLGTVGGTEIAVGPARISVSDAAETFERALPRIMRGPG
jgi:phosphoribosylformylglycinamidine synthase subunit PurL